MEIRVDQQFLKHSDQPAWHQQPVTFLSHSDAQFELQQIILTIFYA